MITQTVLLQTVSRGKSEKLFSIMLRNFRSSIYANVCVFEDKCKLSSIYSFEVMMFISVMKGEICWLFFVLFAALLGQLAPVSLLWFSYTL